MIEPRILSRLVYFVAVAETRAFTRAAERLGITKAVVSQQVARLEEELGTGLLVRTTRRVELTVAGRLLYERASVMLQDAQDAIAEVTEANSRPQGTLRVVAPTEYGTRIIVPAVAAFLKNYPECRADLRFNDRIVDILADEIDVSIRVGWLTDSSLRARRIGGFEQILVASPRLASELKTLRTPTDLASLPFVANTALPNPDVRTFTSAAGEEVTFHATTTLAINSTRAVQAALLAGAGIAILPDFVAADDLAAGRLLRGLSGWTLPAGGIYAVFPSARFRPPRVTAFIDLLASMIKEGSNGNTANALWSASSAMAAP
ncbi:MAG: LysR family transcriptional regulator [Bradyrhizobium sp.]|nr:LysR family transcriptional regulator [Bradyrhizobium sp.]